MTDQQYTDLMITLKRIESRLADVIAEREDHGCECRREHKDDIVDPIYEDIKKLVMAFDTCSVSFIQREMNIGYSRAARLLDKLEEDGIVSPGGGSTPRKVLKK